MIKYDITHYFYRPVLGKVVLWPGTGIAKTATPQFHNGDSSHSSGTRHVSLFRLLENSGEEEQAERGERRRGRPGGAVREHCKARHGYWADHDRVRKTRRHPAHSRKP
ncbi:hypothetical protein EVAR_52484_1 [Eumeta japonica]|uniref:Uncharacterized protein n=1 Tax=Eumeta variegata TaxID=151549 RepID=A0A4C1Z3G9_EUMVA|nr:hypothetical protein EVAR_52484_1 [Eumeta japonica]